MGMFVWGLVALVSLGCHLMEEPSVHGSTTRKSGLCCTRIHSLGGLGFRGFYGVITIHDSTFIKSIGLIVSNVLSIVRRQLRRKSIVRLNHLNGFQVITNDGKIRGRTSFGASFFGGTHVIFSPKAVLARIGGGIAFRRLSLIPTNSGPSSKNKRRGPNRL